MSNGDFAFTKLIVGDLDRSAAFYRDVFGLTEQARIDATVTGRPICEIILASPSPTSVATLVLFAFLDQPKPAAAEVILGFYTTDLAALVDRALTAGGEVVQPIESMPQHGVKVAFIKDVEGHLIEALERL
jgi:predicted enzyme related to lactoylglutathione lyase